MVTFNPLSIAVSLYFYNLIIYKNFKIYNNFSNYFSFLISLQQVIKLNKEIEPRRLHLKYTDSEVESSHDYDCILSTLET